MDYVKHYIRLMERAKNRVIEDGQYIETHHVIPKSIYSSNIAHKALNVFGIDCKWGKINKVDLLPQEHYIAHLLLMRMFEGIDTNCYTKMAYAANFMNNRVNSNKKYAYCRRKYAEVLSKDKMGKPSGAKGKKWSEERRKIGNRVKGKTYEEIYGEEKAKKLREMRASTRKGKSLGEIIGEERAKIIREKASKSVHSKEWNKKISDSKKGQKMSDECRQKIRDCMSNDLKNPCVNQKLYRFKNAETGEVIEARRFDMKKKYGCNTIHLIMRDKTKSSKGWSYIGDAEDEG